MLLPFCEEAGTTSVSDWHVSSPFPGRGMLYTSEKCLTGTRLRSVWRTNKKCVWSTGGLTTDMDRWVSLMIKLHPDCRTNRSLRTFIVSAGWMNRLFNTLPCKTGLPHNTILYILGHALRQRSSKNTDAHLPIHTASHPVKNTAMNALSRAVSN